MSNPTSKVCGGCNEDKPLNEFPKRVTGKFGRYYLCRICKSAQDKKHYKANSEKIKARVNKVRLENPEKEKERQREKYLKKPQHYIQKATKWAKDNPEKRRAISRRNAAQYEGLKKEKDLKPNYESVLERDGLFCYLCVEDILDGEKYHVDHIIPITKGGWHAEFNLAVAHDICNISKQNKLPDELPKHLKIRVLNKIEALKEKGPQE